jgi:hypothetical protein
LAASTVRSQVSVKLAPVEVDNHPPAPCVLVGRKPQRLAIVGQLGDDGRLLTRNGRVQRPLTGGRHGWRISPARSLARLTLRWGGYALLAKEQGAGGCEMAATSLQEPEVSSPTGARPLDLVGASELDLAQLLRWETAERQAALDRFAWQMLQGAQNVRRWLWTVGLVALALVVGFLIQSP